MSLIDRYILRQLAGAFVLVLGVLTAIVWLTTSLSRLDLLVNQGQTILIFLGVTLLALPLIIALIAPFALFTAFLFVLNKLNTDSELIIMSAAGMSQPRLVRPLLMVSASVTLMAYAMSLVIIPASLRQVRTTVTAARADLISQVIQPGKFTTVDYGLTFHVRDRGQGGLLYGVFVNDARDPEVATAYLGTRGIISKTDSGTFLVLETGQIIRKPKKGNGFPSVITFDSYAFNLSAFVTGNLNLVFPPQERDTLDLLTNEATAKDDRRLAGRIRSELHDRFATPLYSIAFALIAFAALGRAKTTRQSRGESVFFALLASVLVRIGGFMASGFAQREPMAILLIYGVPIGAIVVAGYMSLTSGMMRRRASRLRLPGIRQKNTLNPAAR